ncbi:MAG: MarR family transcriptional regulator [Burkholderiales bacterium]|nr:MarR family transcriptional regulator [Burkholderiales bacterium]
MYNPRMPAPAHPRPAAFYRARGYGAEDSVGYLMRRIVANIAHGVDQRLQSIGLTNAQWAPLLRLHLGGTATVVELARGCQVDAGAMTRMLDRLEAKKLVRRMRATDDRRVVNLELTAEGVKAARQIPGVLCEVHNAHLSGFTRDEWEVLKTSLRRMLANAEALKDAERG